MCGGSEGDEAGQSEDLEDLDELDEVGASDLVDDVEVDDVEPESFDDDAFDEDEPESLPLSLRRDSDLDAEALAPWSFL